MKIKWKEPPNIEKIRGKFPNLPSGVIFTYGKILYIPLKGAVPKHLMVHEKVHVKQQGNNPEKWWDKYIANDKFRLDQEVEAYREQYKFFKKTCKIKNRIPNFLERIASDLSGSIYGNIVSFEKAKKLIK